VIPEHWSGAQETPFFTDRLQAPRPLQVPAQCTGSALALLVRVLGVGDRLAGALAAGEAQLWQVPVQELSQQTPSTQTLLAQASLLVPQGSPRGRLDTHLLEELHCAVP